MYCGLLALCHLRRLAQSGRIHLTDGQHLRFSLYPFVYLYLGLGSNRFFKNLTERKYNILKLKINLQN